MGFIEDGVEGVSWRCDGGVVLRMGWRDESEV